MFRLSSNRIKFAACNPALSRPCPKRVLTRVPGSRLRLRTVPYGRVIYAQDGDLSTRFSKSRWDLQEQLFMSILPTANDENG